MNERLLKLLSECKIAQIPQLINDQKSFIIKKLTSIPIEENKCYRIKLLDNSIISNFKSDTADVEIQKLDRINNSAYCFSPLWEGWIKFNQFNLIQEL